MHDLRRQALLESGKTVSRKARSRTTTPGTSKPSSRTTSRAVSRSRPYSGSASDEDGEGELSDETSFSVGSIDDILNADSIEPPAEGWRTDLAARIEEICARKGSTTQGRELAYKTYIHLLTAQHAEEEILGKESELVMQFLKSIREERSDREAVVASRAIELTLITSPSDLIYEASSVPLKRSIQHSTSTLIKTATIHTLGACTLWGGASDDEILEVMEFLLDIVTSDGHSIDASDSPEPVTAALEEYGLLATLIEDLSEQSEDAVEAFSEQLQSTYPAVQIAAGENIALLYEKSFKPWDPDEDEPLSSYPSTEILSDPDDDADSGPKVIRLYPAYRRTDQLTHNLSELATFHAHHISKAARKEIRTSFSDVLSSVTYPTRPGPRYSNAINQETDKRYGSRMTVRIHKEGVLRINRWWKLVRLRALKRVLQGGFVGHYEHNAVVFETLPILVTNERKG